MMIIMVSNRKLNRAMLIMAVVLNSFLVWVYWTYAPVVFGDDNNDNNTAKVTFFEDGTGVITNGTSQRVQFDYNFTEGDEEELNYTQCGILFP